MDLDVTVALLLEVLLDMVELGADFLEDDDSCLECRLRVLVVEGIGLFRCAD